MASRGRPRSVGNTRMHAAVDALTPMGFSPNIIRNNVKYLLKEVYGGAEGWPFIEAESYRVLIERILEVQEPASELPSLPSSQTEITSTQDSFCNPDSQEQSPMALEVCKLPCLPPQTEITPTLDSSSNPEPQELFPMALDACELPSSPPQTPNISTQDLPCPKNPTENPIQDVQLQISTFNANALASIPPPPQTKNILSQNASLSENPSRNLMQGMEAEIATLLVTCENSDPPATTKPKRRALLGWIGPKDENGFVLLEPMPVEGQQERRTARAHGRRESRWDEKP